MSKAEDVIALRYGNPDLNKGRWKEKEKAWLAEMYANGVEMTDMALMLHRTERAISAQIDKMGLRARSRNSWKRKDSCLCPECANYEKCKGKGQLCD